MFGDNYDIPAFHWYDKTQQKLIVSGKDAAELNARYAKDNGLLRGGTSISNMLNGDAEKSLLTVADIRTDDEEQQKRRAEDIRLLMLDRVIARVRRAIQERAPRPYDLILLSDHGQSFGPTFKMRYGVSLKEFIEQQLPQGVTVAASMGGDTGAVSLTGVSGELANVQQQGGGRASQAVAKRGQKLIDKGAKGTQPEVPAQPAQVTAYGSGNLAQVYFDLYPRKITLSELKAAYPGMVDALVQHEGIGLVCGYLDDGTPVALGKRGRRNLSTGEVIGEDPLLSYAPADPNAYGHASIEKRAWQVRRVMDFPHAGDLMAISTVYPDGTVAALEELIGNHGGLGGEQTDAFIFHPPDVAVPDTRNSTDVYHILNAVRGAPVPPKPEEDVSRTAEISAWSPANLVKGIANVRVWLGYALGALTLDRATYRAAARDVLMTGPALLIALLAALVEATFRANGFDPRLFALRVGLWPLHVLLVFATGRVLSRRGQYTRTLRAVGFAQSAYFLELLAIAPPLAPLARLLTAVVAFFALWIGAAAAHGIKGWRTVLLPLTAFGVFIITVMALVSLVAGVDVAINAVLALFGLAPQP